MKRASEILGIGSFVFNRKTAPAGVRLPFVFRDGRNSPITGFKRVLESTPEGGLFVLC
jgi:hypothetical protein